MIQTQITLNVPEELRGKIGKLHAQRLPPHIEEDREIDEMTIREVKPVSRLAALIKEGRNKKFLNLSSCSFINLPKIYDVVMYSSMKDFLASRDTKAWLKAFCTTIGHKGKRTFAVLDFKDTDMMFFNVEPPLEQGGKWLPNEIDGIYPVAAYLVEIEKNPDYLNECTINRFKSLTQ